MDKMLTVNQKKANKQLKSKKNKPNQQQPLKVVYITNPIKFKATASEFRALVQELTGQGAELPESARFSADDGVGASRSHEDLKVVADGTAHALVMNSSSVTNGGNGSDPSAGFGSSYEDPFYSPDDLWGNEAHLDVLNGFGAM